jgi:hypothetical protein
MKSFQMLRLIVVGCLWCMFALTMMTACAGNGRNSVNTASVRDTSGNMIQVKALDDPANPFKGQYGPWDKWLYENMQPTTDYQSRQTTTTGKALAEGIEQSLRQPANWTGLQTRVTDEGYLQPIVEGIKSNEDQRGGSNAMPPTNEGWIQAYGLMDPTTYEQLITAVNVVHASYYNPIPEWLVINPPESAMLLPNGDVVTSGLLGAGKEALSKPGCCGGKSSIFARYDKDGNLIRTVNGRHWWYLYYEGGDGSLPPGTMVNTMDGYIEFMAPNGVEILSLWNWDGTQLDPSASREHRDFHPFTFLTARNILDYYDAVHANGGVQ